MGQKIAVLVMNDTDGDSRVRKIANTASDYGYQTLLLGIGTDLKYENVSPTLTHQVVDLPEYSKQRVGKAIIGKAFLLFNLLKIDPKRSVKKYLLALTNRRIEKMLPVLLDFQPDLVHANDPDTLRLAFRYKDKHPGAKIIYDAHEYILGAVRPSKGWNEFMSQEENDFLSGVDAIVTVSDSIAISLLNDYKLAVLPNVIRNLPSSSNIHLGIDIARDCNLAAGDYLGVYLGNVTLARGLNVIPESLAKITNLHIALVTKPSADLDSLQGKVENLGVSSRLHVLPYVSHDLITSYIKSATFGIAPYANEINHNMSLPSKFYEYLVAGIPIVSSELPESKKFLDANRVGALFEPNNSASFHDAVIEVIENRDKYLEVLGNLDLTEFTWESQEQILLGVYQGVLT
jgi:glycosyltransferase involved in cell wall biosynthesis